MVQGPNDLEALKALSTPVAPAAPQRSRPSTQTPPELLQAPDTVQLSLSAVQAAAFAKTGAVLAKPVQAGPPAGTVAPVLPPLPAAFQPAPQVNPVPVPAAPAAVPALPTVASAPTAAEPATLATEKSTPVQQQAAAVIALSPAAIAAVLAEPEVRPSQVQAAVASLGSLTGNSGALNASLAQKLLTEI